MREESKLTMKKCVQSARITEVMGLKEGFAAIKRAGFDAVDYNIDQLYSGSEIMSGKPAEKFKDENLIPFMTEVRDAARENGVEFAQMHAPFPSWVDGNGKASKNVFAAIVKSIEMCEFCECPRMIVHPGFVGNARSPLSKEREHEANIKLYTELMPYLKKHKVIGCLENMFRYDSEKKKIYAGICSDMHETITIIDELNEIAGERLFGFCLDTGHLNLIGVDQYEYIMTLGNRLETLHIHDNHGVDDEHIAPYMGNIIWDRFCKGLHDSGYEGNLSFETFGALNLYPDELRESALRLLGDIAELFKRKVWQD